MQPIDYINPQRIATNPIANLVMGLKAGSMIQDLRANREANARMDKFRADMADLGGNFSSDKALALQTKYPEMRKMYEPIINSMNKKQLDSELSATGQAITAARSGNTVAARDIIQQHIDAAENSGMDTAGLKDMMRQLNADPKTFADNAEFHMMNLMEPERYKNWKDAQGAMAEERRKEELQPGALQKQAAELGKTTAEKAKIVAETKKIYADIKKTNADATGVALDSQEKLLKLKGGLTVKLSTQSEKLLNDSVISSTNSMSLATQYDNLASQIEKQIQESGGTAKAAEAIKKLWGSEDNVTRLRQEYKRLRNSQVIANLPPGVASDKDIEVAMSVFPDDTSSPDLIASFMRGMAKLQRYDAGMNDIKSKWIANTGNLGPAKQGMMIDGKEINQGTGFVDFVKENLTIPNVAAEQSPEVVAPQKVKAPPEVGTEQGGYIYQGGDPADPNSWKEK